MVLAALHSAHHGLDVEHLTAERHVGILERVAPLFNVFLDLLRKFLGGGVREYTFGAVTVTKGVDRHILEGHHIEVNLLVVLVRSVIVGGEFAELLNLFLWEMKKKSHGLMKERVITDLSGLGLFFMLTPTDQVILTSSIIKVLFRNVSNVPIFSL